MSWCVARSSTLAIWRRRSPPPMPARLRWHRDAGSCLSTSCRDSGSASSYAVLGSGKTAADACIWLLDNDVEPDRICWIRPRDAWFYDRSHFQPLQQVGAIMEGISSMPRPAPRRRTSTISSSGSRPQGGSCASTPRGRQRCTAARCSVPANWRPCGRSKTSSGSVECDGSRPAGSCLSAGKPKPARTSSTWTAPP